MHWQPALSSQSYLKSLSLANRPAASLTSGRTTLTSSLSSSRMTKISFGSSVRVTSWNTIGRFAGHRLHRGSKLTPCIGVYHEIRDRSRSSSGNDLRDCMYTSEAFTSSFSFSLLACFLRLYCFSHSMSLFVESTHLLSKAGPLL